MTVHRKKRVKTARLFLFILLYALAQRLDGFCEMATLINVVLCRTVMARRFIFSLVPLIARTAIELQQ